MATKKAREQKKVGKYFQIFLIFSRETWRKKREKAKDKLGNIFKLRKTWWRQLCAFNVRLYRYKFVSLMGFKCQYLYIKIDCKSGQWQWHLHAMVQWQRIAVCALVFTVNGFDKDNQ